MFVYDTPPWLGKAKGNGCLATRHSLLNTFNPPTYRHTSQKTKTFSTLPGADVLLTVRLDL